MTYDYLTKLCTSLGFIFTSYTVSPTSLFPLSPCLQHPCFLRHSVSYIRASFVTVSTTSLFPQSPCLIFTTLSQLYGESGQSDVIPLDNKSNNFERGSLDKFTVSAPEVGGLYKIRVWHDDSHPSAGWHLDKVTVVLITKPSNQKFGGCSVL